MTSSGGGPGGPARRGGGRRRRRRRSGGRGGRGGGAGGRGSRPPRASGATSCRRAGTCAWGHYGAGKEEEGRRKGLSMGAMEQWSTGSRRGVWLFWGGCIRCLVVFSRRSRQRGVSDRRREGSVGCFG